MNKLPSVLLGLALLSVARFHAQSPDPKVQTGNSPPASVDTEKPDYTKEAVVIERLYQRDRFENDGTGRKIASCRIHVLNEGGVQAFGQLRFGYNAANERLDIGYVRVIKGDGSVITAGAEAVQDLSPAVQGGASVYTDYHEKHVTVPSLRPGDTLEYEVTNNLQTAFAPEQFWTQHDFIHTGVVLDERLEIDIPITRVVKLKTKPGLDPKIGDENGRRVYRWTSSHLTSSEETKEGKQKKEAKKQKADEVPDVQLTTFSSWDQVGRWYANLERDRRVPSPEVREKAHDLTKGLHSDLEKTEALYTFVAQNFRYVSLSLGLARYQPQAASDVLRNQYGDCKDKNTLLAALLEAEGLHSSTVLINSLRKLDPEVPSPSQFNHAITLVPIGKDEIWLDTTTEVAPFRLIAYPLRKQQALVIPADGTPRLEETPADPFVPDEELTDIDGKVDDSGRLEATITFTARGDSEILERGAFRRIAPAQWPKFAEGVNKALGGDVSNLKVGDVLATREPFIFSYHVSKGNFVDWSKKKLQLRLPLSIMGLVGVNDAAEADSDDNSGKAEPFKIGPTHQHAYRIKLDFAPRYHAIAPVPVSLERDYGLYQSTYKLDGTMFSAERKLTIRLTELPAERAEDYRAFRRTVLADGGQSVSVENTAADIHSAPSDMSVGDLIRNAGEARRNADFATAIDLLNRVVGIEPKNKTAWNDLGLAYFDDHQDGLAINAFQKQIEVNSFDQYAYNNLGRVYLRQRKYEEADKWFTKQIEIQPLDKYAHGNLGWSLTEQHKYEAAVPELEKAAAITPDSTGPQLNLGRAYLNLGQDDKAMAAFDKALTISASASVWNSIAYSLALSKVHLDRARSYAESAVSSTAAALRNVSLSQLNRRDLGHVASLGSYWDTLGWVAYAEGKLEVSEHYVSAAWQLDGIAEEGDHLGRIYEKRGNKAEAAHFYSLALSAERPEPETRDRLAVLVGRDKVDATVEKYKDEQLHSRTYQVPNASKLEGKADFFVLLSRASSDTPSVEGVTYVSGQARLKPMTDALKAAKFNQPFPDDAPAKILRRGTLTCRPSEDCRFVLLLPSEVRSIE